jgi:hypothetical protein
MNRDLSVLAIKTHGENLLALRRHQKTECEALVPLIDAPRAYVPEVQPNSFNLFVVVLQYLQGYV